VRDDEIEELDDLTNMFCAVAVKGGSENLHGKVNILLQTFLSRGSVGSFSLMSDQAYITQVCLSFLKFLVKDTFLIFVLELGI
jgi:activating signal cointegrator complex subunit 3